jgi:YHS domain-containing protein
LVIRRLYAWRQLYASGDILPGSTRRRAPMAIEIDPVCGMEVDTTTSLLSFEYDGTTYWFCGRGCLLEFRDDPQKYLDPEYQASM